MFKIKDNPELNLYYSWLTVKKHSSAVYEEYDPNDIRDIVEVTEELAGQHRCLNKEPEVEHNSSKAVGFKYTNPLPLKVVYLGLDDSGELGILIEHSRKLEVKTCRVVGFVNSAIGDWCIKLDGSYIIVDYTPLISELPTWLVEVSEVGSVRQIYLWMRDFEDDRQLQNDNLYNVIMATGNTGIACMVGFVNEGGKLYLKVKAQNQPQVKVHISEVDPSGLIKTLTLKGDQPSDWFLRHL